MAKVIDLRANSIDVVAIVDRVEELELKAEAGQSLTDHESAERVRLEALLIQLRVPCGDCDDRHGYIYPVQLIRDDYFVTYSKEMAADISGHDLPDYAVIGDDDEIDWEATALNARLDYKSIDIYGLTYWYLSGEMDEDDHVIPRVYAYEERFAMRLQ